MNDREKWREISVLAAWYDDDDDLSTYLSLYECRESPCRVNHKILASGRKVNWFELHLGYYFHALTITLGKDRTLLSSTPQLDSIADVHLQGWFWHWIIHERWFSIKQRNQTKSEIRINRQWSFIAQSAWAVEYTDCFSADG